MTVAGLRTRPQDGKYNKYQNRGIIIEEKQKERVKTDAGKD